MTDVLGKGIETQAEVLSREETQEFSKLLGRFVQAYNLKPEGQSDEDWLQSRLLAEMPELGEENAARQSQETTAAIRTYDESLASLISAINDGKTESEWFTERAQSAGLPKTELAAHLAGLYTSLESSIEETKDELSIQEIEWTSSELRLLGKLTGDRAMLTGIQSAIAFAEYEPIDLEDDSFKANESVALALETGKDAGLKAAAAGALSIAVQKNILHVTVVEAPAPIYANLACASIENVKTAMQLGDNRITESESVEQMAANTAVAISNLAFETAGRAVGGTVLSPIPGGPIIGGMLGGLIGKAVAKMAGPHIRKKVEKASRPIATRAKQMVKQAHQAVNEAKSKAKKLLKGFAHKIFG